MSSKTAARCFILSDTAYATNFNNNVIILDILEDQYITLNEKASDVLRTILTKKNPALSDEETDIINQLLGINLLKKSNHIIGDSNYHFYDKTKKGAVNLDWRMTYGNLNKKVPFKLLLEAYITLAKVHYLIKKHKMYGIVQKLRQLSHIQKYHDPSDELIQNLCIALDKACFFFPVKTVCLPWSCALAIMLLRRNIKSNLKIGVQNYPFLAHAWIEVSGKVIADNQSLSDDLSVIYTSECSIV